MPPRQFVDVKLVQQLLAKGCTREQVMRRTGASKCAVSLIARGLHPSQKNPGNKEAANA